MWRSRIYLTLAVLFWGLSYIAIKAVLRELEPVEMISFRFLLAAPVLYVISRLKGLRIYPVPKQRKLVLAAFIVFMHFWVMANGLKYTSASNTAWILTTAPIFIALVAWVWLREKFTSGQWLGVFLAVAGVLALVTNGDLSNLAWIESRGDVIVLGSCVTWAFYTVATRDITAKVNPLVATFWMTAIAGAVFVPYTLLTSGLQVYRGLEPITWLSLVFLGAFCLATAFWLWADGLSRQTAAEVGVYLYIEPLFTMFFAWILLDERITLWLLVGAVLISLGVWVTEKYGKTRPAGQGA